MINFLDSRLVAVATEKPHYSSEPPYHPSESYPEWDTNFPISRSDNPAYRAARNLFKHLELDVEHFDSEYWNPFGDFIQPGNTVCVKPNLVSHRNIGESYLGITDTDSLVTHGSIIRVVLDYVGKALRNKGKIIIGDCPIQGTDWNKVTRLIHLDEIMVFFKDQFPGIEIISKDFRLGKAEVFHDQIIRRVVDEKSFKDYIEVDLQNRSELIPLMTGKYEFGVSQYGKTRMRRAHSLTTNKYLIHKEILYADVMINMPKMKTHMKAGVTLSLKNFVGIIGHKDYLPHFRFGSPKRNGDEYPDGNWLWDLMWALEHADWELDAGLSKRLYHSGVWFTTRILRLIGYPKTKFWQGGGSWYGNDTIWRTILDINRAFFYFDRENNTISTTPSSKINYFTIIDGLIGGHKESPLAPTPIASGLICGGFNPLAVDTVVSTLMGLDYKKIRQLANGWNLTSLPLVKYLPEQTEVIIDQNQFVFDNLKTRTYFSPSVGFFNHIERT